VKESGYRIHFPPALVKNEKHCGGFEMAFGLPIPSNAPLALPINVAPMLGQMEMEHLHVLGGLLVAGFIVACSVIGWKILQASNQQQLDDHAAIDRRDLDQAA
jgi:hypothetical protein